MITVALPVWNSKKIAWLCMESLCRQERPHSEWELIIFEESHPEQLGEAFFRSYQHRLSCQRIVYLTCEEKVPLPQKWVRIAKASAPDSIAYVMCAADNYYHKYMLCDTESAIGQADWCLMTNGYFYDFQLDQVIRYHYNGIVGLHMAARTEMVRLFGEDSRERGVDSWFANQMIEIAHGRGLVLRVFMDGTDHWKGTVCTNGYNNISTGRINLFKELKDPFLETDTKLSDIVPDDIYKRMQCLKFQ